MLTYFACVWQPWSSTMLPSRPTNFLPPSHAMTYGALAANQEAQAPMQHSVPFRPASAVLSQELHPFWQTPQWAPIPTPISPLGDFPFWPDSKSPGPSLNAVTEMDPNAFPPPNLPKMDG